MWNDISIQFLSAIVPVIEQLCEADGITQCLGVNCRATVDALSSWANKTKEDHDGFVYGFKAQINATFSTDSAGCLLAVLNKLHDAPLEFQDLLENQAEKIVTSTYSANPGVFYDWAFRTSDTCEMMVFYSSASTSEPTTSEPTTSEPTTSEPTTSLPSSSTSTTLTPTSSTPTSSPQTSTPSVPDVEELIVEPTSSPTQIPVEALSHRQLPTIAAFFAVIVVTFIL